MFDLQSGDLLVLLHWLFLGLSFYSHRFIPKYIPTKYIRFAAPRFIPKIYMLTYRSIYDNMAKITKTKIYKVGSRHTIYLPKDFINDSAFPFKPNEELIAKVDGNKIVIEKAEKS